MRHRVTGVAYLLYFLTAISGASFISGIVVQGDAIATSNNILAHRSSYQLGLAIGTISLAFYIVVTARFYSLFRPVNRDLSLLAAFFSLVGCVIQAFGGIFQLAPLVILEHGRYTNEFTIGQLQAQALMFLELKSRAEIIALVFFGLYCLLIGCLIFKSAFLPRFLGVLMMLAGVGWLTFLSPSFASRLSPFNLALGILAEGLLMLWLLVRGVQQPAAS